MTDYRDLHGSMAEAGRQATLREWARKTWLREHMRAETLTSEDLTILDERLRNGPPTASARAAFLRMASCARSGRRSPGNSRTTAMPPGPFSPWRSSAT
jgi:hypothetical protein